MKKGVKIAVFVTLGVILVPILTVGSYLGYVIGSYSRIEDNKVLEINHNSKKNNINLNESLSITSYNVGFGAYSNDFTFFMDSGYDEFNKEVTGSSGKARNKEEVIKNTNGVINESLKLDSDFYLFQEVDITSDRNYKVNQKELINNSFKDYDNVFGINYDSSYLLYPILDPIGKSLSGLNTLSKYKINDSLRKSYTVSTSFDKYFDLDRCFIVNRISINNSDKEFVLINNHMSAYDESGYIRNTQLKELNSFIETEFNKGNYVVVGGDFNHDLLTYNPNSKKEYTLDNLPFSDTFKEKRPDWVSSMFDSDGKCKLNENFKVYGAENNPTCRNANEVYREGVSFVATVDGFIVSNNVLVEEIKSIDTNFSYSDHEPTKITFKLI